MLIALGVGGPSNASPPSGGAPPSAAGAGRVGRVGSVGSVGSVGWIDDQGRAADRLRRRRDRRGRLVRDGAAGLCHARGHDRQRRRPHCSQRSHDCSRPAARASGAGSRSRHQRPGGGRRVERAGASAHVRPKRSFRSLPAPPARAPERAEPTEPRSRHRRWPPRWPRSSERRRRSPPTTRPARCGRSITTRQPSPPGGSSARRLSCACRLSSREEMPMRPARSPSASSPRTPTARTRAACVSCCTTPANLGKKSDRSQEIRPIVGHERIIFGEWNGPEE